MTKRTLTLLLGAAVLAASPSWAAEPKGASPRSNMLEIKFGGFRPLIQNEAALGGADPYAATFDDESMLLFELEMDYQLFQKFGSLAAAFSIGYAEIYGNTLFPDGTDSKEKTGFKVLPLNLLAVYRFDVLADRFNFPLVPFVKGGLVYTPWWMSDDSGTEELPNGAKAKGGKWGYRGTAGLALLLDFFDPRLARDFDSGLGVNHSYLFAEYNYANVNNFGGAGLDLSSRTWMFGLALEY